MPAPPRQKEAANGDAHTARRHASQLARRVRLPPEKGVTEAPAELTARDLVAALRAVSHGADASEILGEKARWEPLFAALLELLLKKHLIADWEFVEEIKRV